MNLLYYGDNLDILRRHVKDDSVDLVYLDPPFNSHATYNVLFAERSGAKAAAQIKAFDDTWEWDDMAARACQEMIEAGGKGRPPTLAFPLEEENLTQSFHEYRMRINSISEMEGLTCPFKRCGSARAATDHLPTTRAQLKRRS
jgi:hypothetical protein